MTTISNIILASFLLLLFGILMFCGIITFKQIIEYNNFCEKIHPSIISKDVDVLDHGSWYDTDKLEPGYIKCCRYYYDSNHTRQRDCEIFNLG